MKWRLAMLPLCAVMAGCNAGRQGTPSDPFLGSPRVPPPGTAGTVSPYHSAPMAAPSVTMPGDMGGSAPLYNPNSNPNGIAPGAAPTFGAPGGTAPGYLPGTPAGASPAAPPVGTPYQQGMRGRSPFSLNQSVPSLSDGVASFRGPGYRPPPRAVTRIAPPATGAADPEQVAKLDSIFTDTPAAGEAPGMSLTASTPGFQERSIAMAREAAEKTENAVAGILETGRTDPPAPFIQHNSIRIVDSGAAPLASRETSSPSSSVTFVKPGGNTASARNATDDSVVEITDLPPARRRTPNSGQNPSSSTQPSTLKFSDPTDDGSRVVLASATDETTDAGPASTLTAIPRHQQYAFDPQYRWLKGKLEFSAISGGWKLRYIPIDGQTDQYGGSVVLKNADQLSGYKAGEMVAIQGSVSETETDSGFAPGYTISRIKRLGE